MKQFEYMILDMHSIHHLNDQGILGWECINVLKTELNSAPRLLLKREINNNVNMVNGCKDAAINDWNP